MRSGVDNGEFNYGYIYFNGNQLEESQHYTSFGGSSGSVYSTGGREVTLEARAGDTIHFKTHTMNDYYHHIYFCVAFEHGFDHQSQFAEGLPRLEYEDSFPTDDEDIPSPGNHDHFTAGYEEIPSPEYQDQFFDVYEDIFSPEYEDSFPADDEDIPSPENNDHFTADVEDILIPEYENSFPANDEDIPKYQDNFAARDVDYFSSYLHCSSNDHCPSHLACIR